MSRKTSVLYSKIVEKFKEKFQFTVSGIVTDFEEALFQSFSNGFPGAVASGCLFHYKKATYKTGILRNGLANLYYSNQEFKSWFQQLMNLPLLPSDKIIETYYLLKDSVPELLHSDKKKITVFFTYYERYWLRKIGPMRLSVFRNEKRTTNDLESFHANLKRKFKSHNPNFWDFIKKLNDVILSSEKDMERINNHLPIRRNSIKPLTLQRKFNEEILQNRLLIGEITPLNYLKSISTDYQLEFQTLDYSTFRVDTNESEIETEGQSGEETNSQFICTDAAKAGPRSCRVCLVTKADTIIFPCRHAQICYSCAENLVTTNGCKQCPICRGTFNNTSIYFYDPFNLSCFSSKIRLVISICLLHEFRYLHIILLSLLLINHSCIIKINYYWEIVIRKYSVELRRIAVDLIPIYKLFQSCELVELIPVDLIPVLETSRTYSSRSSSSLGN